MFCVHFTITFTQPNKITIFILPFPDEETDALKVFLKTVLSGASLFYKGIEITTHLVHKMVISMHGSTKFEKFR